MSDAASDAFLSGQGLSVDPSRVEAELSRLWGPAVEQAGGDDFENPNVTKMVLANLLVEVSEADAERVMSVLEVVATRHPCRAIVLGRTADPGRSLSAEIAAVCHLPAPGLPQICGERIVLKAGPDAESLLPGAVRPLLEADLPAVLWWTGDPRDAEQLYREIAREASRIILDLPDPDADPRSLALGLDPTINPYSRDAAWFGVTPWRELIAQCFDALEDQPALERLASVEIETVSPSGTHPPRVAVWLLAWLAGQLGWKPVSRTLGEPGCLEAVFDGRSRLVSINLQTRVAPEIPAPLLQRVGLATEGPDGSETFRLFRPAGRPREVRIELSSPNLCALPRVVLAPELDPARRIAAALESARSDPPFRRALGHALWLMGE